jgi:hypothetical protein
VSAKPRDVWLLRPSGRTRCNRHLRAPDTSIDDISDVLPNLPRTTPRDILHARRSARIAGADAAIAQTSAHTEEVTRTVLRLAASAYYRALHANERIKLLNATYELGSGVYLAADRRFNAGDIAVLDVNITRFVGTRQSGARGGGSLEIDRARRRPAAPWSGKRRRQVGEGLRLVPLFHPVK